MRCVKFDCHFFMLIPTITVQLNLNLTEHACSKGTTQDDTFFILHACKPSCARKVDDIKPTLQSSRVCTRCVEMHMSDLDYACKEIVSQEQRNKIYKHVYILRCNPS